MLIKTLKKPITMKKLFALLIVIPVLLLNCTSSDQSEQQIKSGKLELELVDSLMYPVLADPIFADVSPSADHILLLDWSSDKILIFETKGKKIAEIEDKDGLPDDPGFYNLLPSFYSDSSYFINGDKNAALFDLSGQEIDKIRKAESGNPIIFLASAGKTAKIYEHHKNKLVLVNTTGFFDSYPGEMAFYNRYKALEIIDFAQDTIFNAIPFDEDSPFKNGMGYITSDYQPTFATKDQKLFLVHGADPRLFLYDISENLDFIEDTIINLPVQDYLKVEGVDLKSIEEGSASADSDKARIIDVRILDDFLLINYFGGMPEEALKDVEILREEDQEEAYFKLKEKYHAKILLFNIKSRQFLGELSLPAKVDRDGFVVRNGMIWAQKDMERGEIEEEFVTLYRFRIKMSE